MSEDLRLSVSKVKCFDQCKKQFEFNYILKFPKKDHSYHIFGKFCHKALEWFHQQYIDGCLLPYSTTMTDAFKAAWSEYKDKMTPEMKKDCWEILNQYLCGVSKDKKNGLPFNVIGVEKRFEFPIGDKIILNGAIDVVRMSADNVLEVADYKTTKNKKYLKDDWFQLMTYGMVMLKERPELKKIRVSYILLRHEFEHLTREFSAKELLSVKQQYIDYAAKILAEKDYEPSPTNLCGWCDYLESCEAGQKQTRMFSGEVSW